VVLHLHEWGDRAAPPLVCLHGVMGHGRRFRKLVEERLAERFHVLAPDLRGHGRSRWEPPWDLATHLGDVLETIEAAGVVRASWLGHSFGGRLVLELASLEPERIERAVLLDPAVQVSPSRGLDEAESERADKSFATVEEAIENRIETAPLFSTPRELLEEEMEEHLAPAPDGRLRYRYSQAAVVAAWSEMCTDPPRFEQACVPTLVVLAERSDLVTAEQQAAWRDALGDLLDVRIVPGGHMILWDAYEDAARWAEVFLTALGETPKRSYRSRRS
jgi:lipase